MKESRVHASISCSFLLFQHKRREKNVDKNHPKLFNFFSGENRIEKGRLFVQKWMNWSLINGERSNRRIVIIGILQKSLDGEESLRGKIFPCSRKKLLCGSCTFLFSHPLSPRLLQVI